jgi:hypothetical protein
MCNVAGNQRFRTKIHLQFYRPKGQRAVANNKEHGSNGAINKNHGLNKSLPSEGRLVCSAPRPDDTTY